MASSSQEQFDPLISTPESLEREELNIMTKTAKLLPHFDISSRTFRICNIGLAFSWLLVFGCFMAAVLVIKNSGDIWDDEVSYVGSTSIGPAVSEYICLMMNILVALVTDCLGYIHNTSLRWALYRENRLFFNTNIRLFTSARRSAPNRWPSNVLCIFCLILCYAATSLLFIKDYEEEKVFINGMALAALGLGVMGQAVVASWCLFSKRKQIPTWSSHPLNNTLAWLNFGNSGYVFGRCMMPVHALHLPAQKSRPQKRQKSPFALRSAVKNVLILVWLLPILAIFWAVTVILISRNMPSKLYRWQWSWDWFVLSEYVNDVSFFMRANGELLSSGKQIFRAILFTIAIQGAQTMGLHCVELLVNISRDERAWRAATLPRKPSKAASKKLTGAQLGTSALKSAVGSWENVLLFFLKAVLHWLLGQSLQPSYDHWEIAYRFDMMYIRILGYTVVAIALALFATYLALQRPKGPQPAAYGHLQTLANLVDDWGQGAPGSLWWGDKGLNEDKWTRHAGTSTDVLTLAKVEMEAEYEGWWENKEK